MTTYVCLLRSNRSEIVPLAVGVELSCCTTCGRISFVRYIHLSGMYIPRQRYCASVKSDVIRNRKSRRLTPQVSRGDRAGRVSRFGGMRGVEDILDVLVNIERAVSGGSKCTAIGTGESAAGDQACVCAIRVDEPAGSPFLAN